MLLYTDAFGVRPELEERARELAGHGYYVLVPNLYYRHGPAPVIELPEHIGAEIRPALIARLMPLTEAHTTERVLRDADAYLKFLTTQPEATPGPVAAIGYCMGPPWPYVPQPPTPTRWRPSPDSTPASWSPTRPTARTASSPSSPPKSTSASPALRTAAPLGPSAPPPRPHPGQQLTLRGSDS